MSVLTLPYPDFAPNSTIASSQHDANNTAISTWANGNIGSDNLTTMEDTIDFSIASNVLALSITNSGTAGSIEISQSGVLASSKSALKVTSNSSQTTGTALVDFSLTGSGSSIPVIKLTNAGTGISLDITNSSTGLLAKLTSGSTEIFRAGQDGFVGKHPVASKSTTYTATSTDDVILLTAASDWTLTLPAAADVSGRVLRFRKTDANTNKITIDGNSSETIDGVASMALYRQGDSLSIISDGSNWRSLHRNIAPVVTKLTSGTSQTFTTSLGCKFIEIEMVGGGGGGGGTSGNNGGAGGDTVFGDATAAGGGAGLGSGVGGAGGSATIGSIVGVAVSGAAGNPSGSGTTNASGGNGGNSVFGGAGRGGVGGASNAGTAAATNSGSGGGGVSVNAASGAGGGGAGAWIKGFLYNPSATYTYSVGTAGSASATGAGSGAGGAGQIIIREHF